MMREKDRGGGKIESGLINVLYSKSWVGRRSEGEGIWRSEAYYLFHEGYSGATSGTTSDRGQE